MTIPKNMNREELAKYIQERLSDALKNVATSDVRRESLVESLQKCIAWYETQEPRLISDPAQVVVVEDLEDGSMKLRVRVSGECARRLIADGLMEAGDFL